MKHRWTPLALAALIAVAMSGCTGTPSTPGTAPAASPAGPVSAPPTGTATTTWDLNPAGAAGRIRAAGLPILTAEGTAEHFHAHLDVIVDGKPVTVPQDIGFTLGPDGQPNGISSVHTHDTSGIIHIEAPTVGQRYTLAQVLQEWGVLGGPGCIGPECGSAAGRWNAYVNGVKQAGDVTGIVLGAHGEIALVYGKEVAPVPSTYSFPGGV